MFERYTEKARRVVFFSRYEASQLGASAIEPEHVLLGLLREDKVLTNRLLPPGVPDTIRRQFESCAAAAVTSTEMPLGLGVKRILTYAAEESERLGHTMIGTEHLLLGLMRETDSSAFQLLQRHGLTIETVRAVIASFSAPELSAEPASKIQITISHSGGGRRDISPENIEQAIESLKHMANRLRQSQRRVGSGAIRKAVFPAAGLGTRFLPATKAQPKEMLPLVDKPLIQYVVEEAIDSGIEQIIIVTGRGKNAIEDHFDISYELEQILEERGKHRELEQIRRISDLTQFAYVRQKKALGLGHAVLVARELVNNEPFAVLLGDDIIDAGVPCLKQMIDVYERHHAPVIGITAIDGPDIASYGVIQATEVEPRVYRINDMVEKPTPEAAPSNLAIIGRYILTPDIFDELQTTAPDARGEVQLTDAIRSLLKKRPCYAYQFQGVRHDAGDKLGFLIATVEFALKHDDVREAFRQYLKDLKL